jgi:hypothetical protein
MPDFTQYMPPGVYVQDDSQPVVTTTSQPGGALVLVGPGLGYQTYTETVRAYSTEASFVLLTQRGIAVDAVTGPPAIAAPTVVRLAAAPGDHVLVAGVDYDFVVDTSGGGGGANALTKVKRIAAGLDPALVTAASTNGLVDGDLVQITYCYSNSLYFSPQLFTDFDIVSATYGDPLVSNPVANPNTTQVVSPITLAAKIAFENNVSQVICVATNPADGDLQAQFVAAYAKLESDYRVGVIVPVFADGYVTGTNTSDVHSPDALKGYITDLKTHLATSAASGFGRTAIVGITRLYDEATLAIDALATWCNDKRVVLAYPNKIVLYNGASNQTTEVDGVYLAAALGGVALSNPVERGLTHKTVSGFTGIPSAVFQRMTKTFKDTLSKSGVSVIEQTRQGTLSVRHGVTTNMASMTTREYSLIRIADTLFQAIQSGMENSNLIGEPIDDTMLTRVKGALQGILEQQKSFGVILDYNNLAVRQQTTLSGDPTIIDCKFGYIPALPLNYITVSFAIDLSSGAVTAASTSTVPTTG